MHAPDIRSRSSPLLLVLVPAPLIAVLLCRSSLSSHPSSLDVCSCSSSTTMALFDATHVRMLYWLFLSRYINCSTRIHNPSTGRYERYCIAPSYGGGCRRETQMWWGSGIKNRAVDTVPHQSVSPPRGGAEPPSSLMGSGGRMAYRLA